MTKSLKLMSLMIALLVAIIFAIGIGSITIPPLTILQILLGNQEDIPLTTISIIQNIRLPRVLLAFLVGAGMAVSGTIMQSVLRNPLASPFTLGVSAGASLGASIFIVFGFSLPFLGRFGLPLMGFLSGLATILLLLALTMRLDRRMENQTLILIGMVLSLFINALLTVLMATSRQFMEQLILWQLGSFAGRGWLPVWIILGITLIGTFWGMTRSRELDIMTFGEEQAQSMGVEVKGLKLSMITLCAFLTGSAVAFVGIVGFVDLIAPHVARRIFGSAHHLVIPTSALFGGLLMLLADLIGRSLFAPMEIPVGAVTALVGAPFFRMLYFGRKKPC